MFLRIRKLLLPYLSSFSSLLIAADLEKARQLYKKGRTWSLFLGVLSLILHIGWEAVGWVYYSDVVPEPTNDHQAEHVVTYAAPFRIPHTVWFIGVYFQFFLFVLSQQVVILSVMSALVLANCLSIINARVAMFAEKVARPTECLPDMISKLLTLELGILETSYINLVENAREFNLVFSSFNGTWYWLDFITCLGCISTVIAGGKYGLSFYICFYGGILTFGMYATVAFLPLVVAHHKVQSILNHLCIAQWWCRSTYSTVPDIYLFCRKSDHPPVFAKNYTRATPKVT